MRQKLLAITLMLFSLGAFAQNRQVTGTVTDADGGAPLPGVNVLIKGTTIGTATDADGKFSLNVPQNAATLVFSFVGYTDQEVSIENISNV